MGNLRIANFMNKGHATPAPVWMFQVYFYFNENFQNYHKVPTDVTTLDTFTCIKIDLPRFEDTLKAVIFLGTEMNCTVYRDMTGETALDFWCQAGEKIGNKDPSEISFLDMILPGTDGGLMDYFTHSEFLPPFSRIDIVLKNINGDNFRKIRLYNPQIKGFEFQGACNYEGDEGLKWTLNVHYDGWEEVRN